ncbi:MAG: hypothetical protein QOE16_846 [Microbacteriaceae bacterium]|nr:hypothetical protein [Microbacteriaceae bacterium]
MATAPTVRNPDRYWTVPIARAIIALVAGVVITFNAKHSPQLGFVVLGGFALATGVVVAVLSWRMLADRVVRSLFVVVGAIGLLTGILALSLQTTGLGMYLYLVSVWAALTGFIELYCGIRSRSKGGALSRDWITVGVLTAALALVFLLIPADAVLAVGLFGAYAVVLGVYLGIGGFSLKWGTQHPASKQQTTEVQS